MRVSRALISVYDKTGIVELAKGLRGMGIDIVSTGGTYRALQEAGVPVTAVSEVTGFPEILGGRVKTLHPHIHAGILAGRGDADHARELEEQGIAPIDLVVVNLYPFQETVSRPGVTIDEAVEQVDIGGPTMIRAAAKNFQHVGVVVNPARYGGLLRTLQENEGALPAELRTGLAREAFHHTAAYDGAIEGYLDGVIEATSDAGSAPGDSYEGRPGADAGGQLPDRLRIDGVKVQELRYGENPHQKAAFYREPAFPGVSIASARQLHGKALSFNNIHDAAAALQMVQEFSDPTVAAVKHTNPCGIATGANLAEAYRRAYEADPVSIFGGIVACNRPVDAATAEAMAEIFLEVVLAPSFGEDARAILQEKRNLRLLEVGDLTGEGPAIPYWEMKRVPGGLLVQDADLFDLDPDRLKVVSRRRPSGTEMAELRFAWRAVKHVKSNAIAVTRGEQLIGVGAGQMNRIQSARLALEQAGERAEGAVLSSDAFFPFSDVVEAASRAGITAIIQPGGSKRDAESIAAADRAGIAMLLSGVRHFKH